MSLCHFRFKVNVAHSITCSWQWFASPFLFHCQLMVVVLVRYAGFWNFSHYSLNEPLFNILNQYVNTIPFIHRMFYLQRLIEVEILRGSKFVWKPWQFLQALKNKGSYQNHALSILSYPQHQQKGKWLPISHSTETDCNCSAIILPTPQIKYYVAQK